MTTYTIASGDTFWALAQRYGCSVDDIRAANPGVVPEQLQIGQVIQLPEGGGGFAPSTNQGSNPGVVPEQLQIGQVIQLPGGGGGFAPSTNQGSLVPCGNAPPNARLDTTLNGRVPGWCEPLRGMINAAAQQTNVPADLIAAVIYQESSGNVNVDATGNPNGGSDSGLMQVNQYTADELERKYPNRFYGIGGSAKNIMLGASYLRDMYDTNADRDWGITLRAYNSGPNGVDKRNLRARPAGTGDSTYVDKVFRFWTDISTGNDPPADHYESIFGSGF